MKIVSKYAYYYITSLHGSVLGENFFISERFKNALDALNKLAEYAEQNIECELILQDIAPVGIAKYVDGYIKYNPFVFEIVK